MTFYIYFKMIEFLRKLVLVSQMIHFARLLNFLISGFSTVSDSAKVHKNYCPCKNVVCEISHFSFFSHFHLDSFLWILAKFAKINLYEN